MSGMALALPVSLQAPSPCGWGSGSRVPRQPYAGRPPRRVTNGLPRLLPVWPFRQPVAFGHGYGGATLVVGLTVVLAFSPAASSKAVSTLRGSQSVAMAMC